MDTQFTCRKKIGDSMTLITDNNRLNYMGNHFGFEVLKIESVLYGQARANISEYDGGFWNFYDVRGIPLFVWEDMDMVTLSNTYQLEYKVRNIVACIAINLIIYSNLSFYYDEQNNDKMVKKMVDCFYGLKDWLYEDSLEFISKEELSIITRFID